MNPLILWKEQKEQAIACMILLAKSIWCFYLVLIQCCSGLELLSQEEVIAQVSLELILLMPSSHQRAISSLSANAWKLSGFLWQFASLKIGRDSLGASCSCISWAPWMPMFWFAEGLGRKTWDQGLCWPWDRKNLGQDLNLIRTRQGPKRTGNKKITVNSHGGMQDTRTAEIPNYCLQQNYMEMSTSGIAPLFVVWYKSGMNQNFGFISAPQP